MSSLDGLDNDDIKVVGLPETPDDAIIEQDPVIRGDMNLDEDGDMDLLEEDPSTSDEEDGDTFLLLNESQKKSQRKDCVCRFSKFTIMLVMVLGFFFCELLVGIIANSLTLISDAFHMLSDSLSLVIGLVALLLSQMNASKKFTFGWGRAEVIGGMINSIFLLCVVLFVYMEAFQRFLETEIIENPLLVLIVGVVGLVINLVGLCIFGHQHGHGHSHDHGDKKKKKKKKKNKDEDGGETSDLSSDEDSSSDMALEEVIGEVEDFEVEYIMQDPHFSKRKKERQVKKLKEKRKKDLRKILKRKKKLQKKKKKKKTSNKKKKKKKKKKKRRWNLNMMGVFLHVLGDTLGSVAVIIACIFNMVFPPVVAHDVSEDGLELDHRCEKNCFVPYIDPLVSCCLATLILFSAIPLLIRTSKILMQSVPSSISIDKIRARILRVEGVIDLHDLHVWELVQDRVVCSMHVSVNDTVDFMNVADEIQKILHKDFKIHASTIQPEFSGIHKKRRKVCKLRCPPDCITNTCCPGQYQGDIVFRVKRKRRSSQKNQRREDDSSDNPPETISRRKNEDNSPGGKEQEEEEEEIELGEVMVQEEDEEVKEDEERGEENIEVVVDDGETNM